MSTPLTFIQECYQLADETSKKKQMTHADILLMVGKVLSTLESDLHADLPKAWQQKDFNKKVYSFLKPSHAIEEHFMADLNFKTFQKTLKNDAIKSGFIPFTVGVLLMLASTSMALGGAAMISVGVTLLVSLAAGWNDPDLKALGNFRYALLATALGLVALGGLCIAMPTLSLPLLPVGAVFAFAGAMMGGPRLLESLVSKNPETRAINKIIKTDFAKKRGDSVSEFWHQSALELKALTGNKRVEVEATKPVK